MTCAFCQIHIFAGIGLRIKLTKMLLHIAYVHYGKVIVVVVEVQKEANSPLCRVSVWKSSETGEVFQFENWTDQAMYVVIDTKCGQITSGSQFG